MDQFEKHIKNNKEFFDEPFQNKNGVWTKLEEKLNDNDLSQPGKSNKFPIMLISFMAIAIIGLIFLSVYQNRKIQVQEMALEENLELEDINEHYGKLVSQRIYELNQVKGLDAVDKDEFLEYISELSEEQKNLKQELHLNIDNDEVMEAIIENFNQQIHLITQFLKRMDKKENKYETGISM